MYAIIDNSGQQHRVEEGQELEIDLQEASAGDEIVFDRVLLVSAEGGVQLGQPTVDGAAVVAVVLGASQGPKLVVQKFRKRKNSRRKTGHRQMFTRVRIDSITSPDFEPVADDTPAEDAPVEDAPVEDAPVEDAPAEDAPAEDAPAEDAPVEDAPAEEAPAEDGPDQEAAAEDAPEED